MACCVDLSVELKDEVESGDEEVMFETIEVAEKTTSSTSSLMETITAPVTMIAKLVPSIPGNTPGAGMVREMVSQQKVRWKDDDVDLDLTYITPKIIAMGFPSYGAESFYRNPIDQVEGFLGSRHKGRYKVYNLCSEREYDNKTRFGGSWSAFPFDDHHPPMPLALIPAFIEDATKHLAQHSENVVAIHCKAGKSRTGMMICCLLLKLHPNLYPTPHEALLKFGDTRTSDGNGVTIPSQKRYIDYWNKSLHGVQPKASHTLKITHVQVRNLSNPGTVRSPFFKIRTGNVAGKGTTTIYNSKKIWTPAPSKTSWDTTLQSRRYGMDDRGVVIEGDIKIEFRDAKMISADESLFRFCFNVSMLQQTVMGNEDKKTIVFSKDQLDQAHKDTSNKKYPAGLVVELTLEPITPSEIHFKDTDGDQITVRKGPYPSTMIYSVNGEPRPPFRAALLDEDTRDYILFPDIKKGISLPQKGRRRVLAQLRELANILDVDNNIPGHQTVSLKQGSQNIAVSVPLPCQIPRVLLDFNSMSGVEFTVSGEGTTAITNTPLLTSPSIQTGPISLKIKMAPLYKYVVMLVRGAGCTAHITRHARIEAAKGDRLLSVSQAVRVVKSSLCEATPPGGEPIRCGVQATTTTIHISTENGEDIAEFGYSETDVEVREDTNTVAVKGWQFPGSEWTAFLTRHNGWNPITIALEQEDCDIRIASESGETLCTKDQDGRLSCCKKCALTLTPLAPPLPLGEVLKKGVRVVPLVLCDDVAFQEAISAALMPFSSNEAQCVGKDTGLDEFIGNSTFPSRYLASPTDHVFLFCKAERFSLSEELLSTLHRCHCNLAAFSVVLISEELITPNYPVPQNLILAHALPTAGLPAYVFNFLAIHLSERSTASGLIGDSTILCAS
eukprot:TRINITY_DN16579_c0_g1_i1.p1 TRINITY_DN16579_c0_g1~~TRINITY_DN16579_c0_g1_i1.p1  ORF type:complete len:896 (+),score=145.90 TRINITY_DN16579_c0_g1_i1:57-2744(+)